MNSKLIRLALIAGLSLATIAAFRPMLQFRGSVYQDRAGQRFWAETTLTTTGWEQVFAMPGAPSSAVAEWKLALSATNNWAQFEVVRANNERFPWSPSLNANFRKYSTGEWQPFPEGMGILLFPGDSIEAKAASPGVKVAAGGTYVQ
jgi:hypothetical protein